MTKEDIAAIQQAHDAGATQRELCEKFGIHFHTLSKLKKSGLLTLRSMREAVRKTDKEKGRRKLSEETKKKISQARISYLKENPDMVPYRLNHYSKGESYPEKYFREWLTNQGISFRQEYDLSVYRLDFLIGNIDLEIDGEQHSVDKRVVESDLRRDAFMAEKSIKVIRVKWSDYCKLTQDEKTNFLSDLAIALNGAGDTPIITISSKEEKARYEQPKKFDVSKEELEQILTEANYNYVAVGKKFNVSDNAIRKRARKFGIFKKSLEYRKSS